MNEKIDLVKILEGCPIGTKFWSSIYGEVKYTHTFVNSSASKIYFTVENIVSYADGEPFSVDYYKDGRIYFGMGECTIFPSKDQHDWGKFDRFWDNSKVERFDPSTLQTFDKVLVALDNGKDLEWHIDFFDSFDKGTNLVRVLSNYLNDSVIPYNDDTKHLIGTTDEAPEFYRYWEK